MRQAAARVATGTPGGACSGWETAEHGNNASPRARMSGASPANNDAIVLPDPGNEGTRHCR
jgi:hypothetical protein